MLLYKKSYIKRMVLAAGSSKLLIQKLLSSYAGFNIFYEPTTDLMVRGRLEGNEWGKPDKYAKVAYDAYKHVLNPRSSSWLANYISFTLTDLIIDWLIQCNSNLFNKSLFTNDCFINFNNGIF